MRAWNVSSWRHGNRVRAARTALAVLSALASSRDGRSRPDVPDVGVHVLADQLVVLAADALRAGATQAEVDVVLADLAAALGLTKAPA